MSRALRLHESHTRAELVAMLRELKVDPESQQQDGIHLLTPKARRLHDDITWAIYWHDTPRGNTRMNASQPETKWW